MGSERERVPIVVDDWPEQVPVTPGELEVIEMYLGRLLDEILSPTGKAEPPRAVPQNPHDPAPTAAKGHRHE